MHACIQVSSCKTSVLLCSGMTRTCASTLPDFSASGSASIVACSSALHQRRFCRILDTYTLLYILAWAIGAILTLMCFVQDQPSHSPQPYASLTSESNKPNATFISTTKRYSPDWLLSHQHHRQQEESPSAPQDLRNRVGEDLWAPGWQSAPFQSSPFQPGSSQAFPLQRPPLLTPHGDSQGGGFDTSVAAAHNNKGKGVLFFHGHIPRGSARFSPDAGAIDPEAALTHKHKLEDMALNKPRQFVDRNGLVTPFFRKVSSLLCIYV